MQYGGPPHNPARELECGRDGVELRGEICADERDRGDDDDRDQRGNEAVLDGRDTGVILRKAKQKRSHGYQPMTLHSHRKVDRRHIDSADL